MKKGTGISLLLLLAVIIGIAIIDAGTKRPVNWNKTYNVRDKNPYGLFVFHKELGNILGKDRQISDFGESIYELLDSTDSLTYSNKAIVDIYDISYIDNLEAESLLDFVSQGGEVFMSNSAVESTLLDTLGIKAEMLDYSIFYPSDKNITYSLVGDTGKIQLEKVQDFVVFTELNPMNNVILGYVHSRGRTLPNFIKVSYGKGFFYLHTLPEVFSNYHMLQENSYNYASKMLNLIQNKEILLSDYYYEWDTPRTPLRVVLTKPVFIQAWYILLVALGLLLIFKSKREQRAVKVVLPEPNLSKEFAKTIAMVYYENGNPDNILHKKIEYFLFAIRQTYQLETMDLLDEKFVFLLSAKSTVSIEDTAALMKLLNQCKQRQSFSIQDVKEINNKIEEFKSKANL